MNEPQQKQALLGHHILMTNLSLFHLLLPILAFSSSYIKEVLLVSLVASLVLIIFIAKGAKNDDKPEFVSKHWQMAWRRARYLVISYVVSASVMGLGLLITATQTDPQMKKILLTTFIPVATIPTLATVILVLVLQTMTIARAKQGLVPNNKI